MSPAATTSLADARTAVLRVAGELFYARGIVAVSMADIRDASGVSMRRLYTMYPSKSVLVAAWLDDRHAMWMAWFVASVDGHVANGTDPVLAAFDAIAEWSSEPGYRGCAFINSLAESSELDGTHRSIITAHKREVRATIARLAARTRPDPPAWLPAALAVLIDGAIVQSAIFQSTQSVDAARQAAQHLLEASNT